MDKFMIDKYVAPKRMDDNPSALPIKPNETTEPIKREVTYYEPTLDEKKIVLQAAVESQVESDQKPPSYKFITIIGLILFIGYVIYYSIKTMFYKNNYLIKTNATELNINLDELKTDVKNFLKEKYEKYLDWKDTLKTSINKYFFKKHLDNGAFKATKYKATNLLSM